MGDNSRKNAKLSVLKLELIKEFERERELSKFQKNMLKVVIQAFQFDYEIGQKFLEYLEKNKPDINKLMYELDSESRDELNMFFKDLEFMKEHNPVDTIKYLISDDH